MTIEKTQKFCYNFCYMFKNNMSHSEKGAWIKKNSPQEAFYGASFFVPEDRRGE